MERDASAYPCTTIGLQGRFVNEPQLGEASAMSPTRGAQWTCRDLGLGASKRDVGIPECRANEQSRSHVLRFVLVPLQLQLRDHPSRQLLWVS